MRKFALTKNMFFSSSGTYRNSDYYDLKHMIDDSINSKKEGFYWLGGDANGYLLIDLKNILNLNSIDVYPYCRSDTYSNYTLSGSNNNSDFKKIAQYKGKTSKYNEFIHHEINGKYRYLRFDFSTVGNWGDCLNEIIIYENDNKCLLKKNDKYYSIKQELYNLAKNSFCEVEKDFNKYGFALQDLTQLIYNALYPCSEISPVLTNNVIGFDKKCRFILSQNHEFYTIKVKPKILNNLGSYKEIGRTASNLNKIFDPTTKLNNDYYWYSGSDKREGLSITFEEDMIITQIELYSTDQYPLGDVKFELDNIVIHSQKIVSESKPMIFKGAVKGKKLDIVRYLVQDHVIQKIVIKGIPAKDFIVEKGQDFLDSDDICLINLLQNRTDYSIVVKDTDLPVNLNYKISKPFRPIDRFNGKIELIKQEEK